MRIALIHKRFTTQGGTEKYLYDLSLQLSRMGHQIHVYCMGIETSLKKRAEGVTFHRFKPVINWNIYKAIFFALKTRKIVDLGYDIVMGFGKTLRHDVYRAGGGVHKKFSLHKRTALRSPIRRVLYLSSPKHLINQWIEAFTYDPKNFRIIIANSQHVKDEITSYHKIPEDRIEVIYNGVDLKRFNPGHKRNAIKLKEKHRIPLDIPAILFVGNGLAKGLGNLIAAAGILEKTGCPEFSLVIVGKDTKNYSHRRQSQQENLKHVYFLGPQINVEKFYGIGDIFVLPTYYDPFANTVLEAMASGLPVITTSQNGASELIANGDNGYVLLENSPKAIAQAIMKLLDEEEYKAAGERAHLVAQKLTIERNADQVLSIFSRLKKLTDKAKSPQSIRQQL